MAQYLSQRIEGPIWLEPTDISFLRARISDVETQVEKLQSQISELTHQKDAKLVEIASLENVLSPIRRVPPEIISEIFELACLPEEGKSMYEHSIAQYTSILCAVCVAWRKVAHATPRLWSELCLSLKGRKPVIPELGWVKEWIHRSQGLPLDLYLNFDTRSGISPAISSQFMENILGFSHKIRLLNLEGHISFFIPLFSLPRSSLPQLEEVYLEISSFSSSNDDMYADLTYHEVPSQIETFLGAPKLRCVELIEEDTTPILKKFALPAEQFTSLKITSTIVKPSYFDPDAYTDILRRCKDLVHLRVDLGLDFEPDFVLFSHYLSISLPSLRSLDISALMISGNDVNLLHCLTTPHLEELTLRYNVQDLDALLVDVTSFQHRSSALLSSLTLVGFWPFRETNENLTQTFTALFSLFPAVRSLRMHECAFNMDELLQALTFTKGHPVLLPKLTNFELRAQDDMEEFPSELTPMILSRSLHDETEGVDGLLRLQKVISELPDLVVDFGFLDPI
ncbi:hypothetical protein BT96DRAFT_916546 [Gymnopus androsaceus JB14]|uniref:Uncharacterized protein n=1 Tax=Gymnopus androsaceus JB14 TaxID=1447944 RepID=A0A6A4I707_9AGAR|nr:hypothetical protein BT96DRAFT_916546 [Gymnopus androsaceus JB14]